MAEHIWAGNDFHIPLADIQYIKVHDLGIDVHMIAGPPIEVVQSAPALSLLQAWYAWKEQEVTDDEWEPLVQSIASSAHAPHQWTEEEVELERQRRRAGNSDGKAYDVIT